MDTLICLDIDGTITEDKTSVPKEIVEYLQSLFERGFTIAFLTGRSFAFATMALTDIKFPYFIGCQNGSVILSMPDQKEVYRSYLDGSILPILEEIYEEIPLDFLIFSGYEKGDFCYYRKQRYSKEHLAYLEDLERRQKVAWQQVEDFDPKDYPSFPIVKCFGPRKVMEMVKERLEEEDLYQFSLIKDPFDKRYQLLQVTHKSVSKGNALLFLKKHLNKSYAIAAGDDDNDESMIEVADKKIVITTAPDYMKKKADIIALSPREFGIIHALNEVI